MLSSRALSPHVSRGAGAFSASSLQVGTTWVGECLRRSASVLRARRSTRCSLMVSVRLVAAPPRVHRADGPAARRVSGVRWRVDPLSPWVLVGLLRRPRRGPYARLPHRHCHSPPTRTTSTCGGSSASTPSRAARHRLAHSGHTTSSAPPACPLRLYPHPGQQRRCSATRTIRPRSRPACTPARISSTATAPSSEVKIGDSSTRYIPVLGSLIASTTITVSSASVPNVSSPAPLRPHRSTLNTAPGRATNSASPARAAGTAHRAASRTGTPASSTHRSSFTGANRM